MLRHSGELETPTLGGAGELASLRLLLEPDVDDAHDHDEEADVGEEDEEGRQEGGGATEAKGGEKRRRAGRWRGGRA